VYVTVLLPLVELDFAPLATLLGWILVGPRGRAGSCGA
jgi:hypothetical protein